MAFVIDAFARRIVGWKVSGSATAGFVLDALEQAIHARRPSAGDNLIHHSDRGSQYLAMSYTQRLAEAKLVPSVIVQPDVWKLPRGVISHPAFPFDIGLGVAGPCFVDLDENGGDEAQERLVVGEDANLDGPALEFLLDSALDGVGNRYEGCRCRCPC